MSRIPHTTGVSDTDRSSGVSRRHMIGGIAAAGAVGLSGCSSIVDWIADQILEDVNLLNTTDQERSGSIEIIDPDDETVLDESFELPEAEDDDDDDDEAEFEDQGVFADVWTTDGDYDVTVELAEGSEIDDVGSAEETVTIEDPDDDHLFVFFVDEDDEDPIQMGVADSFTDIDDVVDE